MKRPSTQGPFAQRRCYLGWRGVDRLLGGHYPSFIALTASCADPVTSPQLRPWPRLRSLCRLLSAPAADGTFSTLFCESFLRCLSPYHGGSLSALAWFFPSVFGLPHVDAGSAFPLLSANAIFRGLVIEVAAISLCSGLTACLPPRSLLPLRVNPQGSRGFYIRAERASLPSHASDMLSA